MSSGNRCERTREWSSRRLDRELSIFEGKLLERHLRACPACRSFEAGIRSTAESLRAAPHEVPSRRVALPAAARGRPFSVGRRRTALVAAAALGLGALVGSFFERPSSIAPTIPGGEVSFLTRDVRQLQLDLPREAPRLPAPAPSPRTPPEGVI